MWDQSSPVSLRLLTLRDLICFRTCFVNAQVCCKMHFVCTVTSSWAGKIQHDISFIIAWKRQKTYYQSLWACFVSVYVGCKTHFVPVSCNLSSSISQDVLWKTRSMRLVGPEQYCCVWLPGMAHDAHLPDQVEILNRPQPPLRPPSLIALAWSSLQCHPLSVVHYCLEMKKNILLKFVSLFCECAGLLQNTFRTCVLHTKIVLFLRMYFGNKVDTSCGTRALLSPWNYLLWKISSVSEPVLSMRNSVAKHISYALSHLLELVWSNMMFRSLLPGNEKNILSKFVSLFYECARLLQNTFRTCVLQPF